MWLRSIRIRLTLWYVVLLTVTVVLLGGSAYWLLSYSLSNQLDRTLLSVGRALAERSHGEAPAPVPSDIDEIFRRFFGFSPFNRYFRSLDPRGRPDERYSTPRSDNLPLSSEALDDALRGLPHFQTLDMKEQYPLRALTMPVMESGRAVRLIQVGMSLQNVYEARYRFLLVLAGLLPVAVLLAGAGGWLLARRALKPVDRMTEDANRIGADHLSERIQESGAGDELDRLARTLNLMLSRLDDAFKHIRQFTADASHELQTPLTIARGELEVALRSPRTPEEYRDAIVSALEEIERISRLVEGLLHLARSEAGVLRTDRQKVDLADVAEQSFEHFKSIADSRSVSLKYTPLTSSFVLGDRELLRGLLYNLLDNAIKYSGERGDVSGSIDHRDGWVCVEVSDTGPGISKEDKERIFEPFYRSSEARSERGFGLGLSIARSIAAAHGGRIEVESELGKGSTFTVFLPEARLQ